MGYHERFARSFQGAENADERGEMVLGLCPAGSCDRTYHGIRTYREVQLLVADETDLGYKVIINNQHWGLIYYNEVFQRLEKGEHLKGYIKEVREDDKIDVSLTPQGYQKVEGIAGVILEAMKTQGGYIPVHDKSDPDVIYSLFRCSKKAFKQAIGALYKQHLITLEDGGIRLVNEK